MVMCGSLNQPLADLLSALTPWDASSIGSSFFKGWGLCQLSSSKRVCLCWCPFVTGGEPLRHAEVNLAYDILPSTESL